MILKPCPFCGGESEIKIVAHIPHGEDYIPRCKNPSCCGRISKRWGSKAAAIGAWNRRAEMNKDTVIAAIIADVLAFLMAIYIG